MASNDTTTQASENMRDRDEAGRTGGPRTAEEAHERLLAKDSKAWKKNQKIRNRWTNKKGDAKKPRFFRFIQFCFILNFFVSLIVLVFESRDLITYDSSTLLNFCNLVFEAVFLWLAHNRYRITRFWGMAVCVFNMCWGLFESLIFGNFDPMIWAINSLADVIMLIYFIRSRKLKYYLDETFDTKKTDDELTQENLTRWNWPFFRNLIIYYCFFSLAGHWMESAFCQLVRLGLVNGDYDPTNTMLWRDWFYPFPMEGFAVVAIAVILYPFWRWLLTKFPSKKVVAYVISFFANMVLCLAIEYIMGQFVNADLQLWDYSDMPFNFQGMICLQNGLGFGVAASLIAWVIYPMFERLLNRVPRHIMNIAFVAVVAAYAIPQTLYLIEPPISYEQTLQEIVNDNSGLMTEEDKRKAQEDLDKLHQLEREHQESLDRIAEEKAAQKEQEQQAAQ